MSRPASPSAGRVILFWHIDPDLWEMSLCRELHHRRGQGNRSVQDRGDCSKIVAIASSRMKPSPY